MLDFFIDLSEENADVNWDTLKTVPGLKGVVLKVSEGVTIQDKMFAVRFNAAKNRNIPILGLYHFYHPSDDLNQQAQNYISTREAVTQDKTIPAVIDLEWGNEKGEWGNVEEQRRYNDLSDFIEVLEQHGYEVRIYTSHSFIEQYLPSAGFLSNYKLWVAWYEAAPPLLPPMWTSYWAWQYTGTGTIAGINGNVDISYLQEPVSASA